MTEKNLQTTAERYIGREIEINYIRHEIVGICNNGLKVILDNGEIVRNPLYGSI